MIKNKSIYSIVVLCTTVSLACGQVGFGTTTPRGALDINKPSTNTSGLVLPTNSAVENMVNPLGGDVAAGTIMYDSTKDCIRLYKSGGWSRCLSGKTKTKKAPVGRIGQWAVPAGIAFNTQLTDANNYSSFGTYKKFSRLKLTDITSSLSDMTVEDLLARFDIIFTGWNGSDISASDASKIKEYVDRGGVALLSLDRNVGSNLLQSFGGNGTVGNGGVVARSTNDDVNNGVFGDTRDMPISGANTAGRVLMSQLPVGSRLLATEATSNAGGWITGAGVRAVFFWDEGVFRASVAGAIDTPQERFIHNVVAYTLDKTR